MTWIIFAGLSGSWTRGLDGVATSAIHSLLADALPALPEACAIFSTDNISMVVQTLGGLGLFLLGMIIMTEGLRELAGDAIRAALMRVTSSPASGAC